MNPHDILDRDYPHYHNLNYLLGLLDDRLPVWLGEDDREWVDPDYKLIGKVYAEKLKWAGLVEIVEGTYNPTHSDGSGQTVEITDIGRAYIRIAEAYVGWTD